MPKYSDEPLQKTTIRLFASDIPELERHYGWGWTEVVRGLVRKHIKQLKGEANGE